MYVSHLRVYCNFVTLCEALQSLQGAQQRRFLHFCHIGLAALARSLTAIACCVKLSDINLHVRCMSAMLNMHQNARIALARCWNLSRPRNRPARELAGPDDQARNTTTF